MKVKDNSPHDEKFWEEFLEKNHRYFRYILARYPLLDQETQDDFLQEALLRAVENYDPEKFSLFQLRGYISTTLRNMASDHNRDFVRRREILRDHVHESRSFLVADSRRSTHPNPVHDIDTKAKISELIKYARILPTRQRQIFDAVFIRELTIEETAEKLGTNEDAVRANLGIIRRRLANELGTQINLYRPRSDKSR